MPEHPKRLDLEPSHLEKFRKIVEAEASRPWSIIVAQVDPDGTASALLLKAVLEHLGAEVGIFYGGTVGHPQNRTIFNRFELEKEFGPIAKLPDEGPIALVDSAKTSDPRFGREIDAARFRVVIDHHLDPQTTGKNGKDRFIWIVSTGAAATLAYRLAKASGAELDGRLSTIGAIGIHSDTDRLRSPHTTPADRHAFSEMMDSGDQDEFSLCCNYPLSNRYFDLMQEVLTNRAEIDAYIVSHPSTLLRGTEGDNLSLFADLLQRDEGHHTAIVWGVVGDWVRVSVRSRSQDLNLGELIDELFGKGTGGAKHGSGGANVKLTDPCIPTTETVERFIAYFAATLAEKIKARVGAQRKKEKEQED